MPDNTSHLVLIGGRSGVGKSAVAAEMHAQLAAAQMRHAAIEGDTLDLAWPAPWQHGLAARNLAAIWQNYRELGYRRLIFTNTVSVLEAETLAAAMGDQPIVTSILLRCSDAAAAERLGQREIGGQLQVHIDRSRDRARMLDTDAAAAVIRIDTDGRAVTGIARDIIERIGWIPTAEGTNTNE